ncbi:MAG: N-formylglutamate amidohydrolase [Proteobacteria bacterium]|nr:N-formylglutamate amidohydrolase [Pseudomonadota bacterium]
MTDRSSLGSTTSPADATVVDGSLAFQVLNPESKARFLLVCDHASRHVPGRYNGLGLNEATLQRHIAWDIGAGDVTRRLVELLDAPAVIGGISRLVIDCNRPPEDPTSIVRVSDGVMIPGNQGIDDTEISLRRSSFLEPYHEAVDAMLDRFPQRAIVPALIPVHSFTPVMDGFERPWHIGVLWDRDPRVAARLLRALRENPAIEVGDNQPYTGSNPKSYSLQRHGEAGGRPHASLEIRQDLIDTPRGVETWAYIVADALRRALDDDGLFCEKYYR